MTTTQGNLRGNLIGVVSILLTAVVAQLVGSPLPDIFGLDTFVWIILVGLCVVILFMMDVFER
ncbi:hypothetical protein [Haladaptatus sp. DYF46]|uniref:hypothetical protein n=1 Tax=Haladaptatus sp. DYF46 TaxID=2886041 RepID=UPI001E63EF7F|nr:hypothetical protein [Haladaptatus sp. DYF46]